MQSDQNLHWEQFDSQENIVSHHENMPTLYILLTPLTHFYIVMLLMITTSFHDKKRKLFNWILFLSGVMLMFNAGILPTKNFL